MWAWLRDRLFPELAELKALRATVEQSNKLLEQMANKPATQTVVYGHPSAPNDAYGQTQPVDTRAPEPMYIPSSLDKRSPDIVSTEMGGAIEKQAVQDGAQTAAERLARSLRGKK